MGLNPYRASGGALGETAALVLPRMLAQSLREAVEAIKSALTSAQLLPKIVANAAFLMSGATARWTRRARLSLWIITWHSYAIRQAGSSNCASQRISRCLSRTRRRSIGLSGKR
jgi:hypothetical protein